MNKIVYPLFFVSVFLLILCSCNEKEKEMDSNSDLLFSIYNSEAIVIIDDESVKKEIEGKLMRDFLYFTGDKYIIEMMIKNNHLDTYTSVKNFKKDKKNLQGSFSFASDAMIVTFDINDKARSFTIEGPLGQTFYNHFEKPDGATTPHVVEDSGVFCLHDDYTAFFKEMYPNAGIELAKIKTDMITLRRLETIK